MEIIVQGHKIETQEIFDIVDIEKDKKMFLNREAGFIIKLIDKPDVRVFESTPYDRYPSQIGQIKDKWARLQNEVYSKWQEDKNELPVFQV